MLNVIDKIEVSFLLEPGGQAYFTVRRDLKKEGIRTHAIYKKPTFQCNVQLAFISIFKNKHCEIYVYQKPHDHTVVLETLSVEVIKEKGTLSFLPKVEEKDRVQQATVIIKEVIQYRNWGDIAYESNNSEKKHLFLKKN